jgi:membrane protein YdbS with pleckstrin-like domain
MMILSLIFYEKFFVPSGFIIYWTASLIYIWWASEYFYTKYTTISFFKDHARMTFTFIISLRKIVPYKNIRQVDFFRGPVGNIFKLTNIKLLSSATVGQSNTGGITARLCRLSDDEEEKIYKTVSKKYDLANA